MQLLNNYLLVEPLKPEQTAGGIFLAQGDEKPDLGVVVETSVDNVPKGSHIIFNRYIPNKVKIDNKEYIIVKLSDVYLIL